MQDRLKAARKAAKLTQMDMAKFLEISLYSYNKKELGQRGIPVEQGVKMARRVGKTTEELFG